MTHEMLKLKFLKRYSKSTQDQEILVIGSTRKLSTVEFMEYLELVGKWASEYLNIVIPEPNAETYEDIL
jgi:hypothetical protein